MLDYYIYFQVVSLAMALLYFRQLQAYNISAFIPLLYLTCIVEITAGAVRLSAEDNYFIYNLYLLFSTPLQLALFYNMLQPLSVQKILFFALSSLLLLFMLVDFYFIQGLHQFNSYSLIFIMLINIIFSSLVLVKRLLLEDRLGNYFKDPYFWINAAILLFSLGTLVVLGLQQYILMNHIKINNESAYASIMPVLNVILYSAFSYAFYLCKPMSPSPSSR